MALYFYEAFSKDGKKVTGHLDATTLTHVRQQLTSQGLYPIKIEQADELSRIVWWRRLFMRGVTTKDKILFTKQLSVLLTSGVPLLQALELLSEYFEGQFKSIIIAAKDDIKQGLSFAKAIAKYPKVFNNIYVQLVRAGEASGKLEVILEHLTHYLERKEETRKRVMKALRQPMIQLSVSLLVVIILLRYVVPSMAGSFAKRGQELPLPTKILVAISDAFVNYGLFIGIGAVAAIGGIMYWRSTERGALIIDRVKLKLPLIGYFTKVGAVVQFSQTLGMLLQSGVNLSEALDIVVDIIDNRVLKNTLIEARDKIVKQGKIAQYLKQTAIFPPIAIYLINTGEQSGELDKMLLTVARNYEEESTELSDNLSAQLGPILLIIMALLVGFIVMSIALPMASMANISKLK